MTSLQTTTPYQLLRRPQKQELINEYLGKPLEALRTPAIVIDRTIFANNCAKMHQKAKAWGASFRAHLKTHKTVEGTKLQLNSRSDRTDAVVVSTLLEAWEVAQGGLVADGTVKDILYGLPIAANKIGDLSALWDEIAPKGGIVRLLIDHPDQVRFLEEYEKSREQTRKWSIFVKIDGGQKRAGVSYDSPLFESLMIRLFESPFITMHGFYIHAGNAYASTSLSEATSFLSSEVEAVNNAAKLALDILSRFPSDRDRQPFVLSVGSTPTAHAASMETKAIVASLLYGTLELHAGNYPMLDLQQQHTGLIDRESIAQKVLATVVSYYPGRGEDGGDEALCDAGAIAMSKDTGPSGSFGEVIGKPWQLGRISQEHGTLTRTSEPKAGRKEKDELILGSMVEIVGQHACLTAAAYPWYYIVDSEVDNGRVVVDIWVPWKGW